MKFFEAFQLLNIRDQIMNQRLPIKVSYKFIKFFSQLENEAKFFNTTLQQIIEEYGKKDEKGNFILTEDGQGVKIQDDKFNECMEKINELNNLEVNFSYTPEFKLSELDSLELEMRYINLLIPYIKED